MIASKKGDGGEGGSERGGGRVWSVVVVAGLGQKAKRITVRSRLSQC